MARGAVKVALTNHSPGPRRVGYGRAMRLREATVGDAEALARGVIEGVEDYPAFAPPGWRAPPLADEIIHLAQLLRGGEAWCLVAECDGELVGQITLMPGHAAPHPVAAGELMHVSNLFVRRDH